MRLFVQFSPQVQSLLAFLVVVLLLAAVAIYIVALRKGELKPRPISWIGWTLIMGISLYSQVTEKGWQWNQIGLALSVAGCVVVAILSLKHGIIQFGDWICLALGMICVVIYLESKDAWTTTLVAILADLLIALPTQHNAYKDPLSEKSYAWHFGAAAYLVNSIDCAGYDPIYAAPPIYLLLMNSSMVLLTSRKRRFVPVH